MTKRPSTTRSIREIRADERKAAAWEKSLPTMEELAAKSAALKAARAARAAAADQS